MAEWKDLAVPDDQQPTDAQAKKNRDEIEDVNATRPGARGNVHSEVDENPADQAAPPPMPH